MRIINCCECGTKAIEVEVGSKIRKDIKIYCGPCNFKIKELIYSAHNKPYNSPFDFKDELSKAFNKRY